MAAPWEEQWEVAEETPKDEKSVGGFLSNIPSSAAGLAEPFLHPIRSVEGIGKVAAGGIEELKNKAFPGDQSEMFTGNFEAMKEALLDRYGSMEAIKETAYRDPVGMMADISAVVSGGAGLAGKGAALGVNLAIPGSRLSGVLSKTAGTLRKTGEVARATDPVNITARGISNLRGPAGKFMAEILGATTEQGSGAIKEAYKATPEFIQHMRGKGDIEGVVNDMKSSLENLKGQRAADYKAKLQQLKASGQSLDLTTLNKELISGLDDFGVKIVPTKSQKNPFKLDFSRSTISNQADQAKVAKLFDDIKSWGTKQDDLTPIGVDTLKRRIGDFYSDSSQARALVEKMYGSVRKELSNVKGYDEMTRNYEIASDMIKKFDSELSLSKDNPGIAVRKIARLFSQTSDYRQSLVEALNKYSGKGSLTAKAAGVGMNKIPPSGIVRPLMVGTGINMMSGAVSPSFLAAMMVTSPRVVGEAVVKLGQASKSLKNSGAINLKEALRPELYRSGQYAGATDEETQ